MDIYLGENFEKYVILISKLNIIDKEKIQIVQDICHLVIASLIVFSWVLPYYLTNFYFYIVLKYSSF